MAAMNRSAANSSKSFPRRFVLLPEVQADSGAHGPRIRRYQLTSVGQGASHRRAARGADIATAWTARDPGPPGGME